MVIIRHCHSCTFTECYFFFLTCSSSVANRTLSPSFTVLKKNFPPSKSAKKELEFWNRQVVQAGWKILVLVECPGRNFCGCHDNDCVEENISKYLKQLTALYSWKINGINFCKNKIERYKQIVVVWHCPQSLTYLLAGTNYLGDFWQLKTKMI